MILKKHKLLFTALTVALALASCNRKTIYSHYEHTPVTGWEANDSLTYDVKPIYKKGIYDETVGIRISNTYPFMGLTLIVDQQQSTGAHYTDTLHASLIDHDGTIQGPGVTYFQYDFPLRSIPLDKDDTLHICIRHNMKREILPGISDIGITLRKKE